MFFFLNKIKFIIFTNIVIYIYEIKKSIIIYKLINESAHMISDKFSSSFVRFKCDVLFRIVSKSESSVKFKFSHSFVLCRLNSWFTFDNLIKVKKIKVIFLSWLIKNLIKFEEPGRVEITKVNPWLVSPRAKY